MSFSVPPSDIAPVLHLDDYRSALDRPAPVDGDEVWAEVLAAARLFGALRDAGMSVRFDLDEDGHPPRVTITDLEGRAIREIEPAVACDPAALEAAVLSSAG